MVHRNSASYTICATWNKYNIEISYYFESEIMFLLFARELTVTNHLSKFYTVSAIICTVANYCNVQGVGPQEYTLIKMKLKEPYTAKLQYVHCLNVISKCILYISQLMYCVLLLLV